MSDLSQRLRQAVGPPEAFQEDLSGWTLEMLRNETVTFGNKNVNRTYEDVWNHDQQWVGFMVSRYQTSQKAEHRKFMRYVELKVEEIENNQAQRPVLRNNRGGPSMAMQSKAKAKPKARGYQSPPTIEGLDLSGDEDDTELGFDQSYMEIMNPEMGALQERMGFMETALQQIMQHMGVNGRNPTGAEESHP